MSLTPAGAAPSLSAIWEGWDGYQTSLVHAVAPLTAEQLAWRPAPMLRSVGEVARHIALGRITWFRRMGAPGSAEAAAEVPQWEEDSDGNQHVIESAIPITEDAAQLVRWLELTWRMIGATLAAWDVSDLSRSYRHTWNGQVYEVSRQWTLWRIMAHDLHHGGALSLLLGMQGIEAFELSALGGHITLPPLAGAGSVV
jgi:uncharacterized damage-inducible protein DinB